MGYDARDISAVVADLLKVYGGPDAWPLLEEGSYEVVQNRLFEIEDEEKQKQDQQLLLEHHDQQLLLEHHDHQLLLEHHDQQQLDCQQVEDERPQHQEPAADEGVEVPMFIEPQDNISISKVPAETKSADDEVEGPMSIEPPVCEAVLPLNVAIRTRPRRPCYGWLSESEDEEEEQPTGQKHEVHVLSRGERAQ